MTDESTNFWPLELHLDREARELEIAWDDGRRDRLAAELLRVESPSAEVQGHGEGKTIVAGKRWVGILNVEAVGNYAHPFVREALEMGWNEEPIGPDYAAAIAPRYFNWRKSSIYGGSNEIQKNIIAKAVLGL